MVATETCTVGEWAVRIPVECCLVSLCVCVYDHYLIVKAVNIIARNSVASTSVLTTNVIKNKKFKDISARTA